MRKSWILIAAIIFVTGLVAGGLAVSRFGNARWWAGYAARDSEARERSGEADAKAPASHPGESGASGEGQPIRDGRQTGSYTQAPAARPSSYRQGAPPSARYDSDGSEPSGAP